MSWKSRVKIDPSFLVFLIEHVFDDIHEKVSEKDWDGLVMGASVFSLWVFLVALIPILIWNMIAAILPGNHAINLDLLMYAHPWAAVLIGLWFALTWFGLLGYPFAREKISQHKDWKELSSALESHGRFVEYDGDTRCERCRMTQDVVFKFKFHCKFPVDSGANMTQPPNEYSQLQTQLQQLHAAYPELPSIPVTALQYEGWFGETITTIRSRTQKGC
jgi:hypothetical protein